MCRVNYARRKQVHWRGANKARDKSVGGVLINLQGWRDLLKATLIHHNDTLAHRHRFRLIVRDINHRRLEAVVQTDNFRPHLDAHFCVQIRERLIKQENGGFAHNGASECHALTLSPRKSLREPLEVGRKPQCLGDELNTPLNFRLRDMAQFEGEGHILRDCHMRIKRVVLEYHRDIAVFGRGISDIAVANEDLALSREF